MFLRYMSIYNIYIICYFSAECIDLLFTVQSKSGGKRKNRFNFETINCIWKGGIKSEETFGVVLRLGI